MSDPAASLTRSIAADLRRQITEGLLRDGEALPSTRELAESFGASVFTISEAMKLLVEEGLVETRDRSRRTVRAAGAQHTGPGDELAVIRAEPDPIERGRKATELLEEYRRRASELAALRSAAIEEAAADSGMSHSQLAAALGISPGRLSQIRLSKGSS